MPNLLYKEESPYLRKHADSPINWYPWGEEALKKAKEEDKPILLSIGYSTCYWCSKMGREAFSDEAIAEFLNKNFVAIKVDREERPDIDMVYMEAATRLTENVGWPLNIFLTPEEKPFFAGTYFDVKTQDGRSDFLTVLKAIDKSYETNRKFIDESSSLVVEEMKKETKKERITEDALNNAIWYMKSSFDDVHGGFGQAPKFLISQQIFFMLRYWYLYREEYVLYMVEKTLDNIAKGEIYDSKRGGFFRYAVGSDWSSPHYEKMLYINALMAMAYLEAYQVIRKENYKKVVEETIAYIEKTLLSEEGGFYSAEDSENEKTQDEKKFIDEKVSTGLNGIAIAAFAMCGKSFERQEYIDIAKNCVQFVFKNLYKNNESLNSYYIRGNSLKEGYASDYVYMIWGLIELYEATYQKEYLEKANELNQKLIDDFWDKKKAGIFLYSKDAEKLIINPKESYDGAIPSANSVCAMNFMRLSRLKGNYELAEMGKNILEESGEAINKAPANYLYNLCAYFYSRTPKEIIVSANREEVLDKLNGEFRPFTLEVLETPENRDNI